MLSVNAHITAFGSKGIFIGDNVGIGRGSCLHASNHSSNKIDIPIRMQGIESNDILYNNKYYSIIIEDDVIIGSNVVIVSGNKNFKRLNCCTWISCFRTTSSFFYSSRQSSQNRKKKNSELNINEK